MDDDTYSVTHFARSIGVSLRGPLYGILSIRACLCPLGEPAVRRTAPSLFIYEALVLECHLPLSSL